MTLQTLETKTVTLISGEDLAAMGYLGRCELIEGKVVMKSPTGSRHGIVEVNIGATLHGFVRAHQLGTVQGGEVGIYIRRDPDTVRAPDVLYISKERVAKLSSSAYLDVAPDLVVEVLSPDDRWSEITQKLREYFAIGVRLVWVADPDARIVYAYRSPTDVREFTERDALSGNDVLPGFSVPVADLFEE